MSIRLMTKIWDSGAYSGGTLLVLLALADFAADNGQRIFPHVETLAEKARLSIRATQMALRALEQDGIIVPIANTKGGRGNYVEYNMDVQRVNNLRQSVKGADADTKGCKPGPERVQPTTEKGAVSSAHIEEPSTEPSRESSREPSSTAIAVLDELPLQSHVPAKIDSKLDGFEEFYSAYPRHVGRGAAERAWLKARKLATGAELMDGARRYADQRRGEDPQFTKHPATWLNSKGWLDEAAPPVRPTGLRSVAAGLADVLNRNLNQ